MLYLIAHLPNEQMPQERIFHNDRCLRLEFVELVDFLNRKGRVSLGSPWILYFLEVPRFQAGRCMASSFVPVGGALSPLLVNFNSNLGSQSPAVLSSFTWVCGEFVFGSEPAVLSQSPHVDGG